LTGTLAAEEKATDLHDSRTTSFTVSGIFLFRVQRTPADPQKNAIPNGK